MALKKTKVNRFDGGIARDILDAPVSQHDTSRDLDTRTFSSTVSPQPEREEDDTGFSGDPYNVVVATIDDQLYGLSDFGGESAIMTKSSVSAATWSGATSGNSSLGTGPGNEMFFEYNGALYFWGDVGGEYLGRYDITTPVANDVGQWQSLAHTTRGPGFHFPQAQVAYFAYDNKLASYDEPEDVFQSEVFAVAENELIVSINSWNDYLVVATNGIGNKAPQPRLHFWDTLSASANYSIPISDGALRHIRNVGGELLIVASETNNSADVDGRLVGYSYNGGEIIERVSLIAPRDANVTAADLNLDTACDVKYGQMYFVNRYRDERGIYRFGFLNGRYVMSFDRSWEDVASPDAANATINWIGEYLYVVHDNASNDRVISREVISPSYTRTLAKWVTLEYTDEDLSEQNKLKEFVLNTKALPSGASIEVSYALDGSDTFTSLFTHDTDGSVKAAIRKIKSIDEFSTIKFMMEFTGNAQMIGYSFITEDVPSSTTH